MATPGYPPPMPPGQPPPGQPPPGQPPMNLSWLPDHRGQPRDADLDMFAPPPPEIGPPISGSSSLTVGKKGLPVVVRLFLCALPLAVGALPAWFSYDYGKSTGTALFFLAVFAVGSLAIWNKTSFIHMCDYVGRDGIAQFEIFSSRGAKPSGMIMRWTDVVALHTSEIHNVRNRTYTHTDFAFGWWDATGKLRFPIAGQYHRTLAPASSRYFFGKAAEYMWNQFLLPHLHAQLQREGSIAFPFPQQDKRVVRIGNGFIDFINFMEQPVRVTRPEIASFSLADGEFYFKHVDARWYSSEGKFKFRYTTMPNAQLFLMMLDNLMGMRP